MKLRHAILYGSFAIHSCGCTTRYGMHYDLLIDPGFSQDQENAIVNSAMDWSRSIAGLTIDYWPGVTCVGETDGQICYRPSLGMVAPGAIGRTRRCDGLLNSANDGTLMCGDGSEVRQDVLDPDLGSVFSRTARHELGHALGLDHTGTGTTMCAYSDCQPESGPTQADIDQFWSLRR